jgi:sugar porter (SP) family MFS transporter
MSKANKDYKAFAIYAVILTSLGGLLYGFDIGAISGTILFIKKQLLLTDNQASFIISAVFGGCTVATLITGPAADTFGRKRMLQVGAILFILGVSLLITSKSFTVLLVSRIIEGLGVGIITIVAPLYISESIPSSIRGRGVTTFQLLVTAGILIGAIVVIFFASTENWRLVFTIILIIGIIFLLGIFLLKESPRWLFKKGQKALVLESLGRTYSEFELEKTIKEMEKLTENKKDSIIKESFFQREYFYPFLLALIAASLTQLTGINAFLQYSSIILKQAGLTSNIISMMGTSVITLVNLLSTILAFFLIDRLGRKPIFIIGSSGIVVAHIFSALVLLFMAPSVFRGYLCVIGLMLFIFFFAMGPGVILWLIISEMLPTPIRSKGMSICLFSVFLITYILSSSFQAISKIAGFSGNFIFCAFFSIIMLIIAIFFIPETKNKTLEEIETYFLKFKKHL